MSKNTFPTLLDSKATLMGSLTRADLLIIGGAYLFFSSLKISGLLSLALIISLYLSLKQVQKLFPCGFFKNLNEEKVFHWNYQRGRDE